MDYLETPPNNLSPTDLILTTREQLFELLETDPNLPSPQGALADTSKFFEPGHTTTFPVTPPTPETADQIISAYTEIGAAMLGVQSNIDSSEVRTRIEKLDQPSDVPKDGIDWNSRKLYEENQDLLEPSIPQVQITTGDITIRSPEDEQLKKGKPLSEQQFHVTYPLAFWGHEYGEIGHPLSIRWRRSTRKGTTSHQFYAYSGKADKPPKPLQKIWDLLERFPDPGDTTKLTTALETKGEVRCSEYGWHKLGSFACRYLLKQLLQQGLEVRRIPPDPWSKNPLSLEPVTRRYRPRGCNMSTLSLEHQRVQPHLTISPSGLECVEYHHVVDVTSRGERVTSLKENISILPVIKEPDEGEAIVNLKLSRHKDPRRLRIERSRIALELDLYYVEAQLAEANATSEPPWNVVTY
jgi:hypothetical protein